MTPHTRYARINARLRQGEKLFMTPGGPGGGVTPVKTAGGRAIRYPRIGIYVGVGASHSWLWFVDMFDRMGFHALSLLDAAAIQDGGLKQIDVLAVSGGDTIAVARALGAAGSQRLRSFIDAGGLYLGACAGAYLVMNSTKPDLNLFNFTGVKITNRSKVLPQCRLLPHKFAAAYGCEYIFHPARDAVRLKTTGQAPLAQTELDAPLYGGPGMQAPTNAQVLATYQAFTPKTVFLVEPELAHRTLMGTAAVVRAPLGRGWMVLYGPHFEHPRFPTANTALADAVYWDSVQVAAASPPAETPILTAKESHHLLHTLKREISNARICAASLEMQPLHWRIGAKYYDPEKIRVFLEAIWYRLTPLQKRPHLQTSTRRLIELCENAAEVTTLVRQVKQQADAAAETVDLATRLFKRLSSLTVNFLEMYFSILQICAPSPIAGVDCGTLPVI